MTAPQRIIHRMNQRVLASLEMYPRAVDRRREADLAVRMGEEERYRVSAAMEEARMAAKDRVEQETEKRREIAVGIAAERERLEHEYADKVAAAVANERARCLAICALWPDNLMAKEIAKRIRVGAK